MTTAMLVRPDARRGTPPRPAPSCIVARGIRKSFPVRRSFGAMLRRPWAGARAAVLCDVALDIGRGEMFGILGLNGAGKTTLLKILAGIVVPDAGSVEVEGHDILQRTSDARRLLAIVTADERSLNWRLSARENLLLFAGLHRMPHRLAHERIAEALTSVELADTGRKLVGAFSSGMRQRLLVARGLLSRPSVLLLDEPTRSLDPLSAHAFRSMLRTGLVAAQGCTVVLATHNAEEAFDYCDRVAVLHRGSVAALGTAAHLAARFVPDRYYIRTMTRSHAAFAALCDAGQIRDWRAEEASDGGPAVTCDIPGGEDGARRVLQALVTSGVAVSRFERQAVALSALIGYIAALHPGTDPQERTDA